MILQKFDIRLIFLLLFSLTLPNSVAINNIAFGLIVLYWLFYGNKQETYKILKTNPFAKTMQLGYELIQNEDPTIIILTDKDNMENLKEDMQNYTGCEIGILDASKHLFEQQFCKIMISDVNIDGNFKSHYAIIAGVAKPNGVNLSKKVTFVLKENDK